MEIITALTIISINYFTVELTSTINVEYGTTKSSSPSFMILTLSVVKNIHNTITVYANNHIANLSKRTILSSRIGIEPYSCFFGVCMRCYRAVNGKRMDHPLKWTAKNLTK